MSSKDPIDIWLRAEQGAAGRKPEHSRASIVQAALALADQQGIDAVSIRKVAASIGAGAASLYRYVKSHDELLELMLDEISGEYVLPAEGEAEADSPHATLLTLAKQGRVIMKRHPWAAALLLSQPSMGPNSLAYLEYALRVLGSTDLAASAKLHTVAMLTAMTSAFVQNELASAGLPGAPVRDAESRADYLGRMLGSGKYPMLAEVMSQALAEEDPEQLFENSISTYLAGAGLPLR